MLKKIKNMMLGANAYAESAEDPEERQQLALAALLVEVARADFSESSVEHAEIKRLLAAHFELTQGEAAKLFERASKAMDESVSLFDFTRALHESMDYDEKQGVIELLWKVALSDNELDKYEDYLVGKVADLLYVSRKDVIRIKNEVAGI